METQGASACGNSRNTANANDDARIRPNANRIKARDIERLAQPRQEGLHPDGEQTEAGDGE